MNSMFKHAGQAVHFSYMISAYPVSVQSTLSGIRAMASDCGQSGIDFSGMNAADIRIECERIRRAVRLALSDIEACALEAKFSQDQREKTRAMRYIANYFRPALAHIIKDAELMHTIVRRQYTPEDQRGKEWSFRAIAEQFGVSKDRVFRAAMRLEAHVLQLEVVALDNLRRKFEERELINTTPEEACPN